MDIPKVLTKAAEICGNRTELAAHLDVSVSSLDKWRREKHIPARHCSRLYRLTGVPLWEMNPDVFDQELTLSEDWEVRVIALIRQAKNKLGYADNLLDDFEMILELEIGDR